MSERVLRYVCWTIVAAAVVFATLYAARPITNWDFWWHVRTGEEIVKTRSLPAVDPFSHTAGSLPWVNQEWLFDVLLYPIWIRFGAYPIRLICGIIAAGTILLVARIAHRWTASPPMAALLALVFLDLYFGNIQIRPQMFSYPFFLLVFDWFYFRTNPPGAPRWTLLAGAAALMIFWANIHAVVLLPVIFYTVYLITDAGSRLLAARLPFLAPPPADRLPWRAHLPAYLILWGCTFINANTWRLHQYVLEASSFASTFVSEWARFSFQYSENRDLPFVIYLVVIASIAVYLLSLSAHARLRARIDAAEVAVAAAAFYFVLTGRRWLWIAIVPALFALKSGSPLRRVAAHLAGAARAAAAPPVPGISLDHGGKRRRGKGARRIEEERPIRAVPRARAGWRPTAAAAATLSIGALLAQPLTEFRPVRQAWEMLREGTYWRLHLNPDLVPNDAVAVMREAGLSGNLFNFYGWGGFLLYTLHPQCRVFVDGRAVLFGPQVIEDFGKINNRRPTAPELLDRYRVDMTVMPEEWSPPEARPGMWVPLFRNTSSAVYGRAGSENVSRAAAYYEGLGIPFDPDGGFVEGTALEKNPAWARSRHLLPQDLLDVVDPLYEVLRSGRWKISGSQVPFRTRIAEAFMKAGDTASAVVELREAHRLDPNDHFVLINLANLEISRGRLNAARKVLTDHLSRHPDDAQARALLAKAGAAP